MTTHREGTDVFLGDPESRSLKPSPWKDRALTACCAVTVAVGAMAWDGHRALEKQPERLRMTLDDESQPAGERRAALHALHHDIQAHIESLRLVSSRDSDELSIDAGNYLGRIDQALSLAGQAAETPNRRNR